MLPHPQTLGRHEAVCASPSSKDERGESARALVGFPRSDASTQMTLLPFLDIIFGTIGVFVVTFAFQSIVEAQEGIPPTIDSVVTCAGDGLLTAHWPDGSTGPAAPPERSLDLLQALASDGRPFRSMLLALGGNCLEARMAFLDSFQRYVDISAQSVMADDTPAAGLMLELYPLGDEVDAAALLEEWREGGGK